jgi:hypothetical protein
LYDRSKAWLFSSQFHLWQINPKVIIKLPFISENYWQVGYLNCMVIVKQFNKETGKAEQHYYADQCLGPCSKQIGILLGN